MTWAKLSAALSEPFLGELTELEAIDVWNAAKRIER